MRSNAKDSPEDDFDEPESASLQQSNSIYEIQKILCSSQYTIGKLVQDYLNSFYSQYKNIRESSEMLPRPLESIQELINDLVSTFNQDFNLGKAQAKDIMPHCRTAIEKYIYNKLNRYLDAMYSFKNQKANEDFNTR